jgi:hypothetical protein
MQPDRHGNPLPLQANPAAAAEMNVPQTNAVGQQGGVTPPAVVWAQPAAVAAVAPYQPMVPAVPALVYQGFLDYQAKSHLEIFRNGIKPLKSEFNCNKKSSKSFVDQLPMKTTEFSWAKVIMIPVGNLVKTPLTEWGQISVWMLHFTCKPSTL